MPKRNLRIVKRVRNIPVLGICEYCNAHFSGEPDRGNAQSAIQEQFNAHKCKSEDASQAAARIVKEATENR
jgi:formylmethanofuran dehydrogenase subunit B